MSRIVRIVVGLGLIGYGVYSGNTWFYLGAIPLITSLINWCPMEKMMGGCKDGECSTGSCCSTTPKENNSSGCCSVEVKEEKISCCSTGDKNSSKQGCCSNDTSKEVLSNMNFSTKKNMVIKILGTGCANCIALKKVVDEAVSQLEEEITVLKVEDLQEIMSYNVVSMPGFVINEKVVRTGKLLTLEEVKNHIKKEQK